VRLFSDLGPPCVFHAVGGRLCRFYPLADRLWRWEVLRRKARRGVFALERVGCGPSFALALAAACSQAQAARRRPRRGG
jgi:hypothetical protein